MHCGLVDTRIITADALERQATIILEWRSVEYFLRE